MSAVERPTDGPDSGGRCCLACGRDPLVPMDRHLRTCRAVRAEADALDVDLSDKQLMADMAAADRGEDWRR